MQTPSSHHLPSIPSVNHSLSPNQVVSWAQRYAAWCLRRELRETRPGQQAEALRRAHF